MSRLFSNARITISWRRRGKRVPWGVERLSWGVGELEDWAGGGLGDWDVGALES